MSERDPLDPLGFLDPLGRIKQRLENLGLTGEQKQLIQDFIGDVSVAEGFGTHLNNSLPSVPLDAVINFLKKNDIFYVGFPPSINELLNKLPTVILEGSLADFVKKWDIYSYSSYFSSYCSPGALVAVGNNPNAIERLVNRYKVGIQDADVCQVIGIVTKIAKYCNQNPFASDLRPRILPTRPIITSTPIMGESDKNFVVNVTGLDGGIRISIYGKSCNSSSLFGRLNPFSGINMPIIPLTPNNLNLIARMSL